MFLGVIAITSGIILLMALIVAYSPWLMLILCVGLLLVCVWVLTGDLVE
jgi:hypothetical protein